MMRSSLPLLAVVAACQGDKGEPIVVDGPTWDEVAPIFQERCVHCHQDGAVGPMRLDSFDATVPYGDLVRTAVVERTMPPFLADGSGKCNTYTDSEWLSDEEIATVADWVDAGMLAGTGDGQLDATEPERLDDATHSLYSPEAYNPGGGGLTDDWRCFVLEPDLEEDRFLTAWEVVPDNVEIAHHATIFVPVNAQAADQVRALDEDDEGPGYTCFGDARAPATLGAIWSPGRDVYHLPDGVGIRVGAGIPMVMQMHFSLPDDELYEDQSRFNVVLAEEADIAKELHPFVLMNDQFEAPPGEENYEHTLEVNLGDQLKMFSNVDYEGEVELVGTGTHMHLIGASSNATAVNSDGEETCIIDVPRWDYFWHNIYFYEEPVRLHTDDTIRATCSWDTTGMSETTIWGDDLTDEMCAFLIPAVLVDEGE